MSVISVDKSCRTASESPDAERQLRRTYRQDRLGRVGGLRRAAKCATALRQRPPSGRRLSLQSSPVPLEKLDCALVPLRLLERRECSKVPAFPGSWIRLP